MDAPPHSPTEQSRRPAWQFILIASLLAVVNGIVWYTTISAPEPDPRLLLFTVIALLQMSFGVLGLIAGVRSIAEDHGGPIAVLLSVLLTIGAPIIWYFGIFTMALSDLSMPLSAGT